MHWIQDFLRRADKLLYYDERGVELPFDMVVALSSFRLYPLHFLVWVCRFIYEKEWKTTQKKERKNYFEWV